MDVCRSIEQLRAWRAGCTGSVGLVPTMGALHAGHASLLQRLRGECDQAVCSIFVNPTQFGTDEDLARYPRPLDADLALCEAGGIDTVFLPSVEEMYPADAATTVDVGRLGRVLEGESRPDHFNGVATVVLKLFNLVQPDRAYFGEKDFQQLSVIRQLIRDLDVPIEIVPCSTIREADGLALSSRNVYLSEAEREAAPALHSALRAVRQRYASGESNADELLAKGRAALAASSALFELDYLALVDPVTLIRAIIPHPDSRLLIAARLGSTRLIDNLPLVEEATSTAGLAKEAAA